jgi:hypothetical protein
MKFKVLDQPERDFDPMQMSCCSYNLFSWGTISISPEPKKARLAKVAKAKASAKGATSAKRKVAA